MIVALDDFVWSLARQNRRDDARLDDEEIEALAHGLRIRLQVEWLRAQRHCSNLFFEDILRERADILYRYAAEHIFDNNPMEITRCLDYYSSPVQAH